MKSMLAKDHPLLKHHENTYKKNNVPEKHRNKLHCVGQYKGHLKHVKGFFNHIDRMQADSQLSDYLGKKMSNPEKLDSFEKKVLSDKGFNVDSGFVSDSKK